jgi:Lysozyme like domain
MATAPNPATGGAYTFGQLEALWIEAGGNPAAAPVMAGVALAESEGDPSSNNLSDPYGGSYGLWQINGAHAGITDRTPPDQGGTPTPASQVAAWDTPLTNAKEAVALYNTSGLEPWQGDPIGSLFSADNLPSTEAVVAVLTQKHIGTAAQLGDTTIPGSVPNATSSGGPIPTTGDASAAGAANPESDLLPSVLNPLATIEKDLTSSAWWKRIGVFALGGALFIVGLMGFLSTTNEGKKVISEGESAAALAAVA